MRPPSQWQAGYALKKVADLIAFAHCERKMSYGHLFGATNDRQQIMSINPCTWWLPSADGGQSRTL
jgi:hypothetical protein